MIYTGIISAGVAIIAIVRIAVGKTHPVGAEFAGIANGVTLTFFAADADTVGAELVGEALGVCDTIGQALPIDARFVGIANPIGTRI